MAYRLTNSFTLLFAAVAVVMFVVAAVAVRHRSRRVATPLAGFSAAVGLWSLGDAIRIAATTESGVWAWNKVAYLGIVAVPPTYFYFVTSITNRERWFRRRYVAGMIGISAIAYGLILTNSWHHLWHSDLAFSPGTAPPVVTESRGAVWYFWATYVYTVIAAGVYFLAADLVRSSRSRLYRSQVGLVLVGIVVPWVANLLFTVFDVVQFDPLPIALSVTGVSFAAAIFRYDLLDIAPIARDVVLSNLDSGVVVLDADDAVVDANERARAVLDLDQEAVPGIALERVLAQYPDVVDRLQGTRDAAETVSVDTGEGRRHYEVEVSPITDELGTYIGRVVVFSDVTERIRRERDLQARTERLRERNERLDELASLVSHDLRNPLDVNAHRVRRLRTLLEDADIDPGTADEVRSELSGIERATDRAAEISGDLLTISREDPDGDGTTADPAANGAGDPESGAGPARPDSPEADGSGPPTGGDTSAEADPTPVSLRSVATAAWDTVETGELELTISGSRPIAAEESSLRRLLENCYRNVVDHADGATAVVVGVTGDGFYVDDDGPGIDERDRDRVLERGYSTAPDGSGLGLALVTDVADDHGWGVAVGESESGGTRVAVRIDTE